jgi:hypothetical protein
VNGGLAGGVNSSTVTEHEPIGSQGISELSEFLTVIV